jgi:hypothetical protein
MEELILKLKLNGVAIQYSGGFPTDLSECCIWLTPFVIPQPSLADLTLVIFFWGGGQCLH